MDLTIYSAPSHTFMGSSLQPCVGYSVEILIVLHADKETEAQSDEGTFLRAHSQLLVVRAQHRASDFLHICPQAG